MLWHTQEDFQSVSFHYIGLRNQTQAWVTCLTSWAISPPSTVFRFGTGCPVFQASFALSIAKENLELLISSQELGLQACATIPVCLFVVCFWGRVSPCSGDWPGTHFQRCSSFFWERKLKALSQNCLFPAVKSDVNYVVSLTITSLMYPFDLANISLGSY